MAGEFWSQWCDKRGTALTHAHWDKCGPKGHPGSSPVVVHQNDQCCHCGRSQAEWDKAQPTPAQERRAETPHAYQFTVVGRCAECQQVESAHLRESAPDDAGCTVDHTSIATALLVGDEGRQWKTCPMCGTYVEAKMATGIMTGPSYGRGRLPFTQRHMNELARLKQAWEGGYYKS